MRGMTSPDGCPTGVASPLKYKEREQELVRASSKDYGISSADEECTKWGSGVNWYARG